MKIIAQSQVLPKGSYVHLAYTSAGQDQLDAASFLFVLGSIVVAGFYLVSKLFKRLF